MVDHNTDGTKDTNPTDEKQEKPNRKTPTRVPGNLPYVMSSGTLKRVLEKLIDTARPEKFNIDFVENMLKVTGSAGRASIPIVKKMGLATSDGTPTALYAKFRTSSGRADAALLGLKNAFPEIFKRSEYAHTLSEARLKDVIVEITGLKPSDSIVMAIKSTFMAINALVPQNYTTNAVTDDSNSEANEPVPLRQEQTISSASNDLRISYNINIVIPETSDVKVLSAIFRTLKENLMQ